MHHQQRNHRKTTSQCLKKNTGVQIWKIGQEMNGGSLIARLSSDYILHGVAEHVQCSVKSNRDTKKAQQPEQTNVNFSLTLKLLKL